MSTQTVKLISNEVKYFPPPIHTLYDRVKKAEIHNTAIEIINNPNPQHYAIKTARRTNRSSLIVINDSFEILSIAELQVDKTIHQYEVLTKQLGPDEYESAALGNQDINALIKDSNIIILLPDENIAELTRAEYQQLKDLGDIDAFMDYCDNQ